MPNHEVLKKDESNHVLTPGVGSPTSHLKGRPSNATSASVNLGEIREQPDTGGEMGPQHRSVLEKDGEGSTSNTRC